MINGFWIYCPQIESCQSFLLPASDFERLAEAASNWRDDANRSAKTSRHRTHNIQSARDSGLHRQSRTGSEHMQTGSTSSVKNQIEANVTIQRPVSEVFAFYRDFRNLPKLLRGVMEIEPTGPASSRWTIEGLSAFESTGRWR